MNYFYYFKIILQFPITLIPSFLTICFLPLLHSFLPLLHNSLLLSFLQDLRGVHHLLPARPRSLHADPLCGIPAYQDERAHGGRRCVCAPAHVRCSQVPADAPHREAVQKTVLHVCCGQRRVGVCGCGGPHLSGLCGSVEWEILLPL